MRSCSFVLSLLGLAACGSSSEPNRQESLDVFATLPDGPTFAVARRSFGVGVQSELRVAGDLGIRRTIRAVRCPAEECAVDTAPSARAGTLFLVTPKVSDFHVHIDFDPEAEDATSSLDRVVHAENGALVPLHLGAGPGVPFVEGMHVIWYFGTKAPGVAFSPTRVSVRVTAPFQMVDAPRSGDGPDQDLFLRVEIAAPVAARGKVIVDDGTASTSFELIAVPRSSIKKLLLAPIPSSSFLGRVSDLPFEPTDRIRVPSWGVARAWLAFETADGTRGIAGAGDCLPAVDAKGYGIVPYARAFYGFELDGAKVESQNQPYLQLEGHDVGTSKLLLAFGELEGTALINVGGK